jgi:hypothetical protein
MNFIGVGCPSLGTLALLLSLIGRFSLGRTMDQKDRTCFLLGFGLLISNRSANFSFEIRRDGIHLVYRAPIHM